MSKMFTGSICLSDLMEQAKKANKAFSRSDKNKKVYANVIVWLNDDNDQFGNIGSIQLSKEKDSTEKNIHVGNFKTSMKKEPEPLEENNQDFNETNLPF